MIRDKKQRKRDKPGRVITPLCSRDFESAWADKAVPALPLIHKSKLSKGFTLLELIIVICISVILIATFLNRVLFYQEQAEKWTMIEVVNATQSALHMQELTLLIKGEDLKIAELAKENPINWLDPEPNNYVGEFFDPAPDAVGSGNWAFDLKTHELIYIPEHTGHLSFEGKEKKWIRFRIKFGQVGAPEASEKGGQAGISFGPVEPYHWGI